MQQKDLQYMQRALDLALKGMGKVAPNPMVGCVIVRNDEIIGEGYHEVYGGPHAEPNAVNSVEDKSMIPEATVYVSLEPCSHYGKTPPCAELLSNLKPKRVVICNDDPNPLVSGRGVQMLLDAGIEVESGVLVEKGRSLNKRFFTFQEKKRPYVILKWAQTKDGFVARSNFDSKWISGEESRKLVHKWRGQEASIMVGTNTAKHDDPQLNVRMAEGKDPIRVVIDRELTLSPSLKLFDQSQPTLVYNSMEERNDNMVDYVKINFDNDIIPQILSSLFKKNVNSLIVEGGSNLLNQFIHSGLWDEAKVFKSTTREFGEGIPAPQSPGVRMFSQQVENDRLEHYVNA